MHATRLGDCHLDPDPVHYMDLIDSEERFLQKAVDKKHNFSNCECFFVTTWFLYLLLESNLTHYRIPFMK